MSNEYVKPIYMVNELNKLALNFILKFILVESKN